MHAQVKARENAPPRGQIQPLVATAQHPYLLFAAFCVVWWWLGFGSEKLILRQGLAWKTLDWKKGGGNTERALKNGFGAIPYFLEIANVGEAYFIFEKN
jgi:hypothetical protein